MMSPIRTPGRAISRLWSSLWGRTLIGLLPRRRQPVRLSRLELLESRRLLTTYEVGPGLAFTTLGAVPWNGLQAGDTVAIHYQPQPYHELILISGNGTAAAPIRVLGVAGPNGERPVIDGQNAVLGPNLDYVYSGIPTRGLVTISPDSNYKYGDKPSYIEISGLQIRNAHVGNSIVRPGGTASPYLNNAAGIYVERGEHITVRDCEIDHNSNGLFVASGDDEATQSREILVQASFIHDNGNAGSDRQHNVYTEAIGMTFEDNHFAPLLPGAGGNNIKDRSAGLIVRNNWIEGGAHLLDLVDAEGSYNQAGADPRYQQTFVYGNVLLNTAGPGNASNLVHYGGDSGDESIYRQGTLYFYNNTVVIQGSRSGPDARWFTSLFRFDTNQQIGDIRNNIFYAAGDPSTPAAEPTGLALFDDTAGTANFGVNWISPDWHTWRNDSEPEGSSVTGGGNFLTNPQNDPGFMDLSKYDLHLKTTSAVVDQSGALAAAVIGKQEPTLQYVVHGSHAARPVLGAALDLGAFEGPAPVGPGSHPIQNNNPQKPAGPSTVKFLKSTIMAVTSGGQLIVTVSRGGDVSLAGQVKIATKSGTARAGVSFTALSQTIQFAPGEQTRLVTIELLNHPLGKRSKSFQLILSQPSNGMKLDSRGKHTRVTLKTGGSTVAT